MVGLTQTGNCSVFGQNNNLLTRLPHFLWERKLKTQTHGETQGKAHNRTKVRDTLEQIDLLAERFEMDFGVQTSAAARSALSLVRGRHWWSRGRERNHLWSLLLPRGVSDTQQKTTKRNSRTSIYQSIFSVCRLCSTNTTQHEDPAPGRRRGAAPPLRGAAASLPGGPLALRRGAAHPPRGLRLPRLRPPHARVPLSHERVQKDDESPCSGESAQRGHNHNLPQLPLHAHWLCPIQTGGESAHPQQRSHVHKGRSLWGLEKLGHSGLEPQWAEELDQGYVLGTVDAQDSRCPWKPSDAAWVQCLRISTASRKNWVVPELWAPAPWQYLRVKPEAENRRAEEMWPERASQRSDGSHDPRGAGRWPQLSEDPGQTRPLPPHQPQDPGDGQLRPRPHRRWRVPRPHTARLAQPREQPPHARPRAAVSRLPVDAALPLPGVEPPADAVGGRAQLGPGGCGAFHSMTRRAVETDALFNWGFHIGDAVANFVCIKRHVTRVHCLPWQGSSPFVRPQVVAFPCTFACACSTDAGASRFVRWFVSEPNKYFHTHPSPELTCGCLFTLWRHALQVQRVHLDHNPWVCDCALQWMGTTLEGKHDKENVTWVAPSATSGLDAFKKVASGSSLPQALVLFLILLFFDRSSVCMSWAAFTPDASRIVSPKKYWRTSANKSCQSRIYRVLPFQLPSAAPGEGSERLQRDASDDVLNERHIERRSRHHHPDHHHLLRPHRLLPLQDRAQPPQDAAQDGALLRRLQGHRRVGQVQARRDMMTWRDVKWYDDVTWRDVIWWRDVTW